MTLPSKPLPAVVELLVDGAWVDITTHVYSRDPISITRGRANESSRVEASRCTLTVNNRDGRYSPRKATSPYHRKIGRNTPIRVSVDGDIRFIGEVAEWPVGWDKPGADVWVEIEAAGILRRLGQGIKPLRSALYREITSRAKSGLLAYWPCEDSRGATQVASAIGGPPMRIVGTAEFESYNDFPASDPLPNVDSALFVGPVPRYTTTGTTSLRMLVAIPTTGATTGQDIVGLSTTGSAEEWRVVYNAASGGSMTIVVRDGDWNTIHTSAVHPASLNDTQFSLGLLLTQNGSNIDYDLRVLRILPGGASTESTLSGTVTSRTVGRVTTVGAADLGLTGSTVGHICLAKTAAFYDETDDAVLGWAGEPAGRRVERLCTEDDIGVSFINIGNLDETAAMGPQRSGALLTLLGECADADLGILYEPRDNLALTYRTRLSLYNQDPGLELDYSAGVFTGLPEPVDDDQATRNDIVATRQGGSSVRCVLESGPMSIQAPPDGVGIYDTEVTVSLVGDGFLHQHCMWLVALGTVDEARYPRLSLGLHIPAFMFSTAPAPNTFETDLESWAAGGSVSPTVTRDSTRAHSGTWSMKIVWGTGGTFPQSAKTFSGLTIGTRYQVSGWAWVTVGSPAVRFAVATVSPAGPSTVTEGAWERFTYKFTATATSHSLQIWPARDPVSGESVWIDDITPPQQTYNGDDVAGLDLGDLIVVSNLPAWLPPEDVAQLAQGFTEILTPVTWNIDINCVPASPYQISLYQSAVGSTVHKYDTAGSELNEALTTTETDMDVLVTIKPLWTTDDNETPLDVMVGGERMTVTDIATAVANVHTFTVVRSVNGVVKAHDAGTTVRLATTPRYGL